MDYRKIAEKVKQSSAVIEDSKVIQQIVHDVIAEYDALVAADHSAARVALPSLVEILTFVMGNRGKGWLTVKVLDGKPHVEAFRKKLAEHRDAMLSTKLEDMIRIMPAGAPASAADLNHKHCLEIGEILRNALAATEKA